MFVKPVKGRSVPDPARGDLLPAEGRNVDENNYWLRREAACRSCLSLWHG